MLKLKSAVKQLYNVFRHLQFRASQSPNRLSVKRLETLKEYNTQETKFTIKVLVYLGYFFLSVTALTQDEHKRLLAFNTVKLTPEDGIRSFTIQ